MENLSVDCPKGQHASYCLQVYHLANSAHSLASTSAAKVCECMAFMAFTAQRCPKMVRLCTECWSHLNETCRPNAQTSQVTSTCTQSTYAKRQAHL